VPISRFPRPSPRLTCRDHTCSAVYPCPLLSHRPMCAAVYRPPPSYICSPAVGRGDTGTAADERGEAHAKNGSPSFMKGGGHIVDCTPHISGPSKTNGDGFLKKCQSMRCDACEWGVNKRRGQMPLKDRQIVETVDRSTMVAGETLRWLDT
jgi:hypothetical protein